MKTTSYFNTFIEVAEDSPADTAGVLPLRRGKKIIAYTQYEILKESPYEYTSDDILFLIYAGRNNLTKSEYGDARKKFFSKGQPCFRSSPLTKRYGWGVHSDAEGKIAIYAVESEEYQKLSTNANLTHLKAMRSKRK